ncbi:P-loop NTPase fold protein [Spirosoma sp. SC4-14]|uniref:KAP family P-loop NTPase fold protein n=1 Tax=Spirosoma sp. SC4-14 TaxID=3128900 RepID=UPI0030CBB882
MELDKPVADHSSDRFQRYNFAKRIAQTILARPQKDSLTIGLYGKWGEGKTSVIEFISRELEHKAVIIRFNPWQFAGERVLIMAFFEQLAEAVNIQLLSKGDKLAQTIRTYGGLATLGKFIPKEAVESFASFFSKTSLSGHHKKISEALGKSAKPIVIFIDDIDRLESTEIQAVFKLVKIVADFPNIVYLLAFDPDRVIDALRGTFGDGQAYLEKIIQVPLTLPKAQPAALRKYTYDLIAQAVNQPELSISEDELNFFRINFEEHLADYIVTPRDPARISNAIRFSLPMLSQEAHIGDLMLLEAIKVLYPTLYQSIRNNPQTYLRAYDLLGSTRDFNKTAEDKKKAIADIDSHLDYLPATARQNLQKLVQKLFPQLDGLYRNISYGDDSRYKKWHQQKRLCSYAYFERYFTYAVIEGQISDIVFETLLSQIELQPLDSAVAFYERELGNIDPHDFILKLRFFEGSFTEHQAKQLAYLLCRLSRHFFINDDIMFSLADQTAGQIEKYISLQPKEDQVILGKNLIETINPLPFALPFQAALRRSNIRNNDDTLLSDEVINSIEQTLFDRLLTEIEPLTFFTDFIQSDLRILFQSWAKNKQATATLRERTIKLLDADAGFSLILLRIMAPSVFIVNLGQTYKSEIREEDFSILQTITDGYKLYQATIDQYGQQSYSPKEYKPGYSKLSDMEIVGQYQQMFGEFMQSLNS